MIAVAALCVAQNSVYKALEGVECFDKTRGARSFAGGMPVVAHPPCRAWSAYTRHQAKPEAGEADLGLWCADQLRTWGGVLEHPAHSRLFDAAGLPKPGRKHQRGLWTIAVWQCWWGYPMRKATWLCFAGVDADKIALPYKLHDKGLDRRRQQLMSKHQRAQTTEPLARWLVAAARMTVDQPQ